MTMQPVEFDITRTLVSNEFIYTILGSLFPDSVFLNSNFKIMSVSSNIQQSLGYGYEEICGKSVSCLESSGQLETILRTRLQAGYFSGEEIKISKKWGGSLSYSISGFYLGLITDFSNHIVLRFTNKDEINELDRKLLQTKTQVDNFIYRAAHDLRGPLATIKGLVNLLKIRTDNSEVDRLIPLIDAHSKTLDDRLHQLVYIAESEVGYERPSYKVDFIEIENHLRRVIEKNAFIDFLELSVNAPPQIATGFNEVYTMAVLTNILLHLLSLPKSSTNCYIDIHVESSANLLNFIIKAQGFQVDEDIKKNFEDFGISIYSDLLRYSKLTHFFAAQKIALKMKATLNVDFITSDCQLVSITIPRQFTHD